MFKTIILCALYNLSDDQVEHQIRDRLSFMRFLGLGLEGRVPDAKTVWLYREQLTQAGVIEALFETFDGYLKDQGYLAMGGQGFSRRSISPFEASPRSRHRASTPRLWRRRSVPKQRNSREENARIKISPRAPERRQAGRTSRQSGAKRMSRRAVGALGRSDRWPRQPGFHGVRTEERVATWPPSRFRPDSSTASPSRHRPLRLQEPCQRGPSARPSQAGAALPWDHVNLGVVGPTCSGGGQPGEIAGETKPWDRL